MEHTNWCVAAWPIKYMGCETQHFGTGTRTWTRPWTRPYANSNRFSTRIKKQTDSVIEKVHTSLVPPDLKLAPVESLLMLLKYLTVSLSILNI